MFQEGRQVDLSVVLPAIDAKGLELLVSRSRSTLRYELTSLAGRPAKDVVLNQLVNQIGN